MTEKQGGRRNGVSEKRGSRNRPGSVQTIELVDVEEESEASRFCVHCPLQVTKGTVSMQHVVRKDREKINALYGCSLCCGMVFVYIKV